MFYPKVFKTPIEVLRLGKNFFKASLPPFSFFYFNSSFSFILIFMGEVISLLLQIISFQTKENKAPSLSVSNQSEHHCPFPSAVCFKWKSRGRIRKLAQLPLTVFTWGRSSGLEFLTLWNGLFFHPQGGRKGTTQKCRIITTKNVLERGAAFHLSFPHFSLLTDPFSCLIIFP